jgi:hypothetical protein
MFSRTCPAATRSAARCANARSAPTAASTSTRRLGFGLAPWATARSGRVSGAGITIKNGRFEDGNAWTVADSGGALVAGIGRYDSDPPQKAFDAVAKAYAADASK